MNYYIKQKVFSLRDKFTIMDASQNVVYTVEGKMFSLSNKMELLNTNGSVALKAHKKVFTIMPKYFITDPHDEELAVVQRKFALRPKFHVMMGHKELMVDGSLFAHSFSVSDETGVIASIEKKIISWGDTYEIRITNEQNSELLLFIVIIIDQVIHEQKNNSSN